MKIVICRSNVRAMTSGQVMYHVDNNGFLSLMYEGGVKQFNYIIGHAGNPSPRMGAAWGPPYKDNLLPQPEAMFCPMARERAQATFDPKLFMWEGYLISNAAKDQLADPSFWFDDPRVSEDYYMGIGYAVRPVTNVRWEYGTGERVRCRAATLPSAERVLVATERLESRGKGHASGS